MSNALEALVVLLACVCATQGTSSSHVCEGDTPETRTCELFHVCYVAGRWKYYSPRGQPSPSLSRPLLRTGTYSTSETMSVDVVASEMPEALAAAERPGAAVVFHGGSSLYFHWLLDDVFGLHWTLRHHDVSSPGQYLEPNGTTKKKSLAVLYVGDRSPHAGLLRTLFTEEEPLALDSKLTACFSRVAAGPAQHNLGGPGMYKTSSEDVRSFSRFVMSSVGAQHAQRPRKIVVVQRRTDRQILNARPLTDGLRKAFGNDYDVQLVQLEDMPFAQQVRLVSEAALFVAIHGSAMSNILFLPPGASALELFPYGFERPTFKGISMKTSVWYLEWHNTQKSRTRFHPEILDRFNLDAEARRAIVEAPRFNTTKMPWAGNMYWINQDTTVNLKEVIQLVKPVLAHIRKEL
eukprot:m51a1_g11723 putative protein o-linked-mannose beta- -n-acetylglucosaminyltransferase 2 (406) ;mRNA; f:103391-104875